MAGFDGRTKRLDEPSSTYTVVKNALRRASAAIARNSTHISLHKVESNHAISDNVADRGTYRVEHLEVLDQVQLDSMECWTPPDRERSNRFETYSSRTCSMNSISIGAVNKQLPSRAAHSILQDRSTYTQSSHLPRLLALLLRLLSLPLSRDVQSTALLVLQEFYDTTNSSSRSELVATLSFAVDDASATLPVCALSHRARAESHRALLCGQLVLLLGLDSAGRTSGDGWRG